MVFQKVSNTLNIGHCFMFFLQQEIYHSKGQCDEIFTPKTKIFAKFSFYVIVDFADMHASIIAIKYLEENENSTQVEYLISIKTVVENLRLTPFNSLENNFT